MSIYVSIVVIVIVIVIVITIVIVIVIIKNNAIPKRFTYSHDIGHFACT